MGVPDPEGPADVSVPESVDQVAHAYYCWTHSLDARRSDAALQLLSADERRRSSWIFRETDRRDYVAAHALLRAALSAHTLIRPHLLSFEKTAAGRPYLVGTPPDIGARSFSLSHSAGLVACVIASDHHEAGIDVEAIDHSLDVVELAGHVCSAEERLRLRDCPAATRHPRFFELWTLKEAFLKAQGVGLSGLPTVASFHVDGQRIRASLPPMEDGRTWSFLLAAPGVTHILGIAIARIGARPSVRIIPVDAAAVMCGALVPLECATRSRAAGQDYRSGN